MMLAEFPQAAGVTGLLTAAGLDSAGVHEWFHRRRVELAGLSPALVLATQTGRGPGNTVLALARADALELHDTGRLALIGGDVEMPKHAWEGSD